jgi:hypothetical protein
MKSGNPDLLEQQGAEKIIVGNHRDIWIQATDTALKEWCQGDCVLGEHWFVHRFNPQRPLTSSSADVAQEEIDLAESEVRGFAVDIQRSRQPQYAYIPGVAEFNLVADLDRVMTVEKAVVAEWKRKPGCLGDDEVRSLGQALARKRARFAFPDDFTDFARKLQSRLRDKHNKATGEGEALRALREIRVRAEPSWNSSEIRLIFWFIRDEDQNQFEEIGWNQFLQQWLELVPESGRYQSVEGLVVALEDMTAKEYVESVPLDLDHLSS